jgi:hypothetical protein
MHWRIEINLIKLKEKCRKFVICLAGIKFLVLNFLILVIGSEKCLHEHESSSTRNCGAKFDKYWISDGEKT